MRTLGNTTDFGDVLQSHEVGGGACNATRGIFAGGYLHNRIQFITMATAGNAIDFGDLNQNVNVPKAASSKTRGLIIGGTA